MRGLLGHHVMGHYTLGNPLETNQFVEFNMVLEILINDFYVKVLFTESKLPSKSFILD